MSGPRGAARVSAAQNGSGRAALTSSARGPRHRGRSAPPRRGAWPRAADRSVAGGRPRRFAPSRDKLSRRRRPSAARFFFCAPAPGRALGAPLSPRRDAAKMAGRRLLNAALGRAARRQEAPRARSRCRAAAFLFTERNFRPDVFGHGAAICFCLSAKPIGSAAAAAMRAARGGVGFVLCCFVLFFPFLSADSCL